MTKANQKLPNMKLHKKNILRLSFGIMAAVMLLISNPMQNAMADESKFNPAFRKNLVEACKSSPLALILTEFAARSVVVVGLLIAYQ